MSAILDRLRGGPTLLLDGGLGTLLISRGLVRGQPPESWNLERLEDLASIHREYVEAGSEAVHTNTFGANGPRLARFRLAEKIAEINAAAVRAAREARARFVIADVGPTGEYLPPVGNGDPEAWKRAFEAQGRLLGRAGVDALHLETFSDLREALIALEAIRAAVPGVPVFASMTFDRKKSGFHSIMGNPLAGSLRALAGAGADAVGANCTLASSDMKALAAEARGAVDVPLVIQPNAGQPEIMAGSLRYSQEPEAFAADLAAIAALGVEAVGGCCGTDPRFIAALRPLLAGPRAARRSEA